ncbi:MAG: hypothetical protein WA459_22290 [Stellaceae bacterium]
MLAFTRRIALVDIVAGGEHRDQVGSALLRVLLPLEEFLAPLARLQLSVIYDVAGVSYGGTICKLSATHSFGQADLGLHPSTQMLIKISRNYATTADAINGNISFDLFVTQGIVTTAVTERPEASEQRRAAGIAGSPGSTADEVEIAPAKPA